MIYSLLTEGDITDHFCLPYVDLSHYFIVSSFILKAERKDSLLSCLCYSG